jgi:hypothetical protein
MIKMGTINSNNYYNNYYGHNNYYLDFLIYCFKFKDKKIIYLAGDSTLDNKHWIQNTAAAVNLYYEILKPDICKTDMCYWINVNINEYKNASDFICINTAVEEASLSDKIKLNSSDSLISKHITSNDILIVSIGGNDIALKPNLETIKNLALILLKYTANDFMDSEIINKPEIKYFIDYFYTQILNYINKLICKDKPSLILICWIYFLDLKNVKSWSNTILNSINYSNNPERIQSLIRIIYTHSITKIKIDNVQMKYFPMYEILDGTDTNDYAERVEPSSSGSMKLAKRMTQIIFE